MIRNLLKIEARFLLSPACCRQAGMTDRTSENTPLPKFSYTSYYLVSNSKIVIFVIQAL
ncbi:MAG: hypothetical protein L0Y79_12160 [Chlorobi bacterium]|nr:hypothetical protein [Chlorobiota bacterium]MCI0715668.1 hypothetical protein [Chlorobiota bacterium]